MDVFFQYSRTYGAVGRFGNYRWKFLKDAIDLDRLEPVAHTAFRADISTTAVDLREPPFNDDAVHWTSDDYSATQVFARAARDAEVGGIVCLSVRDPEPSWCVAVLTPQAFASRKPDPLMQTWWIAVRQDAVVWRREHESLTFSATGWVS